MRECRPGYKPVIDVVAGSIVGPGVGHLKAALKRDRSPDQVSSPGCRPGLIQRTGERACREKNGIVDRMQWVGRGALPDQVVLSIDHVVPGASVPMVVATEYEEPRPFQIQGHVEVVGKLIQEMRSIFVSAA